MVALATACGDGHLDAFEPSADGRSGPPEDAYREFLIDDLEDGDKALLADGYQGWWYDFNDHTSVQIFEVLRHGGERSESHYAAWTSGANFTEWGAGLGVDLGSAGPGFDSTEYLGFTFWTRVDSDTGSMAEVRVLDQGGRQYAKQLQLSQQWTKHVVYFDELVRVEWEAPGPLDRERLAHLQLFWLTAEPFEAWVDDLAVIVAE